MLNNVRFFDGVQHQPFRFGEAEQGALLIHGFPGTPSEMRPLGRALAARGWNAQGPMLPGFGPQITELWRYDRHDWLQALRARWDELRQTHRQTALVGYSMGAALALHLACEVPPARLVLIAPFWKMRMPAHGWALRLLPVLKHVFRRVMPFKDADFDDPALRVQLRQIAPDLDLDDPAVQAVVRREIILPTRSIDEVRRLGLSAYRCASRVQAPTLIVQGRHDQTVWPADTHRLFQRMNNQSELRVIDAAHDLMHSQTLGHDQVISAVAAFLDASRLNSNQETR